MDILLPLITLLCCTALTHAAPKRIRPSRITPLIIVPGNSGSQIELKVEREAGTVPGCEESRDWHRAWLNVQELMPGKVKCWASNFKLEYNATSGQSQNAPGVTSRVPGFGTTDPVEFIDPSWSTWLLGNVGAQFAPFVKELKSWGYTKGETLFGAPYDFRLSPHSLPGYFSDLRALVEKAHARNHGKRVMLLAHSQGGLMVLYFLRQQSQAWKDKYIQAFMAVGTPWGGSGLMLKLYTSGHNSDIDILDPLLIRDQQRSMESGSILLPRQPAYSANETLIVTPDRNYTIAAYDDWFEDVGFPLGKQLLRNVQGDDYTLEHPGVDMFCWHGSGFATPEVVEYGSGFPDAPPTRVRTVNGDMVVSRRSLRACQHFMNNPTHVNSLREFRLAAHLDMFTHRVFENQLKRVLLGKHRDLKKNFDFKGRNKYRFLKFKTETQGIEEKI